MPLLRLLCVLSGVLLSIGKEIDKNNEGLLCYQEIMYASHTLIQGKR